MKDTISILLINPWITDFAAYNLWSEPLGLLYVAAVLKAAGATISYIDCTSSRRPNPSQKKNGCSKYHRRPTQKPDKLRFMSRNYAVYGMEEDEFLGQIGTFPQPDVILITSHMTYWYPGVFRAIELAAGRYEGKVPVILGGIYAKLCTRHARLHSGASFVFTSQNLSELLSLIERATGKAFGRKPTVKSFCSYPHPLHELGPKKKFFSVLTGRGCPFSCSYCASSLLWEGFSKRDPGSVVDEIESYTDILGTENVAFYDDALLVDAHHHIIPILESCPPGPNRKRFHLPNGIHACFVDRQVAATFEQSGVETIRIGLETADPRIQQETGSKTTNEDYMRAVAHFRSAGYSRKQIGTYIIAGMPRQTLRDVESSIEFVFRAGAAPYLSYYSPIPGTAIWKQACKRSPFPIDREPLFQNNSVYLLGNRGFTPKALQLLKDMAVELRDTP
jgi:hypothetical protein